VCKLCDQWQAGRGPGTLEQQIVICLQALANWPPETEGEKAIATKWFALAKGGELFLAQKPATSNNNFVPMVTVPLAGCHIHVPTEGLRGKSK